MPHEYLIFIHGVSQDSESSEDDGLTPKEKHQQSYDSLYEGISKVGSSFPNRAEWKLATPCYIEWGSNFDQQPDPKGDRLLAAAQDNFANRILPNVQDSKDFALNPVRAFLPTLRTLMIKGFSDMFYYVSREGKNSVRKTIALQILECIQEPLASGEPISLTFFGHSAGSVVAFDFLFSLFFSQEHLFLEDEMDKDIKELRSLVAARKLRVRRLITFGSPISMLAFRSDAVLKVLANNRRLNPSDYGFDQDLATDSPLTGGRWLNFWDKDDLISWPVEPLMKKSDSLQDIYLDAGDHISSVHNEYWTSKKMHAEIAARW